MQEVRAEFLEKELKAFDEHSKKIQKLIEKVVKDFPESTMTKEKQRKWESMLNSDCNKKDDTIVGTISNT